MAHSPNMSTASPPVATNRQLPELLSPAGDWECAKAAVENGADAIYFGLEKFNARMRAHNFTVADLPKLMEFLHRRGVKGYVTFNTLVFENELADATDYLRAIIAAGVALGVWTLLHGWLGEALSAQLISVGVAISVAGGLYLGGMFLLRVPEAQRMLALIRRRPEVA